MTHMFDEKKKGPGQTVQNNGIKATHNKDSSPSVVLCKVPLASGTNVFRAKYTRTGNSDAWIGVGNEKMDLNKSMGDKHSIAYNCDGAKGIDNDWSAYGSGFDSGDEIEVLVNVEEGWLEFKKNGESQGRIYEELKSWEPLFFGVGSYHSGESWEILA